MIMKQLLLFMAAVLMAGCDEGLTSGQQAQNAAEAWADAYFNCDFKDAKGYVTDDSQKWLQYAASNTTQQDLDMLKQAGGAQVTDSECDGEGNDTLRLVTLSVSNVLTAKGVAKEATFHVAVVKRDAGWQVRMEGLPQSGMRSRD